MKVRVIVEYDTEIGSYAVYCPELPGCASAGDTEEEALENIKEAIILLGSSAQGLLGTPGTSPQSAPHRRRAED